MLAIVIKIDTKIVKQLINYYNYALVRRSYRNKETRMAE